MTQDPTQPSSPSKGNGLDDAGETANVRQPDAGSSNGTDTDALTRQLQDIRTETDRFRDQLLRKAAEFENYKRRTEADLLSMQKFANERLLLSLLPIIDDFSRSMKSGAGQKGTDAFYHGIELIYSKFLQILKTQGVEPIEATGKQFNVDEHDALMQIYKPGTEPHTVLEEVERGYRLNDKVLRHAKVVVASDHNPVEEQNEENDGKA